MPRRKTKVVASPEGTKRAKRKTSRRTKKTVTKKKAETRGCVVDGCRRAAVDGPFCKKCALVTDASDIVVKVTEIEALQFGKMDAELRNHVQGLELISAKVREVKADFQAQMVQLEASRKSISMQATAIRPRYDTLISELAERYGVADQTKMAIDPDTRILRDLTKEATGKN
jgi:hypothetical protein